MSENCKITCLKFSLVAVFLLFLQGAFAQRQKAEPVSRMPAVDEVLENNKKLYGNDFSVVIAVADSVAYQKTVGDMQAKTPVPIGNSSQWLTAALILQLADEGKLSLDDKVGQYLPIFDSYRKSYITIRHCLTNMTGIGTEGFKPASFFEKKKFNTLEEEIPSIAKKEIHANAGEQFRYSSYGMIIAARIAEIVTKKRFDQIVRTKLFVPLGMRNTSFVTDDGTAPNPANGAKSTAADYAKFLQLLLNKGKAGDRQILSEAAVAELRKVQIPQTQVRDVPKGAEGFAFALGSWANEDGAAGANAGVLSLPGWNGAWPVIDFNRGYALVILPKDFSGEQSLGPYASLKTVVDQQFRKN